MKRSRGIGFCGLLTLIFVVFKLLGKITWSWWWVFAPLWIGTGIVLGLIVVYLILFVLTHWDN